MKYRILSLSLLALLITAACNRKAEPQKYTIRGTTGYAADSVLYAVTLSDSATFKVDTLAVTNGAFSLEGTSDSLVQVNLYYNGRKGMVPLYVEKNNALTVTLRPDSLPGVFVAGDSINTAVFRFRDENAPWFRRLGAVNNTIRLGNDSLLPQKDSITYQLTLSLTEFVDRNRYNPASLILIKQNAGWLPTERINELIGRLRPSAKPELLLEQIALFVEMRSELPLYQRMPAVTFRDPEGKRFPILNTKGGYSVITFWASWDSTSVKHVKQLKELSKQLKERNVEFFTVSFDTNDSIFKEKVKAYGIPGNNIRMEDNFSNPIARKLGVRTLPANIVTDTTVLVVRKNCFGKELTEYLKSNAPSRKKETAAKKKGNDPRINVKKLEGKDLPIQSLDR